MTKLGWCESCESALVFSDGSWRHWRGADLWELRETSKLSHEIPTFMHGQRMRNGSREEISESILALAADAARKMGDESKDQELILEDLIARLRLLAVAGGADMSLFPELDAYREHVMNYPID